MNWKPVLLLVASAIVGAVGVFAASSLGIAPVVVVVFTLFLMANIVLRALKDRWPDFMIRGENWTARHPWLNALIFGFSMALLVFIGALGEDFSIADSLFVSGVIGSLVFIVFARWTKQWINRRADDGE